MKSVFSQKRKKTPQKGNPNPSTGLCGASSSGGLSSPSVSTVGELSVNYKVGLDVERPVDAVLDCYETVLKPGRFLALPIWIPICQAAD